MKSTFGKRFKKMSNILELLRKEKKKPHKKKLELISVAIIKSCLSKFSSLL